MTTMIQHNMIERYNYISITDPPPPPPINIFDFDGDYYYNISHAEQDRIREAMHDMEFDYVERRIRRNVEGPGYYYGHETINIYAAAVRAHEDEEELLERITKTAPQREPVVKPADYQKLPRYEFKCCNDWEINRIYAVQIIVTVLLIVNFGQIVAGTHHIVHQRMRVEGPILYELLICKNMMPIGDYLWEFANVLFHGPYSFAVLYIHNKYTSFLCIGYPLVQYGFLVFRLLRDYASLYWAFYMNEEKAEVPHFFRESGLGFAFDFFFSILMVFWFYIIFDNKMLVMREIRQSGRRQLNRELEAKYLNRIKLRRKVTRQTGRIQKGYLVRKLMQTKDRKILEPKPEELILEFAEGMNRYRVLCGAEWLRQLNIPQGYSLDNKNLIPPIPPPPPPPPVPKPRKFSWSEAWRPPYRYIPPCAPPILNPLHDLAVYRFQKPRFAKFRDRLLLVYNAEDYLKAKRKELKIRFSTGSFAWDQK